MDVQLCNFEKGVVPMETISMVFFKKWTKAKPGLVAFGGGQTC